MEHSFFATSTADPRAEALRWLSIAEKLLTARDLMGSKSFATRARDSDPTLVNAEEVLAVAETLIAGDRRVGGDNQLRDWYAVLGLTPLQGREADAVANRYSKLMRFLNPSKNKYPFAEEAFRLVLDAWQVLSTPSSKARYNREIGFHFQQQQKQQGQQTGLFAGDPNLQENVIFFGGNTGASGGYYGADQSQQFASGSAQIGAGYAPFSSSGSSFNHGSRHGNEAGSSSQANHPNVNGYAPGNGSSFTMWTACPYCYYMYEYDRAYVNCVLRCQNCKNAFEAVEVSKPPLSNLDGENGYFYSWAYIPLGYTSENSGISRGGAVSGWTPFSPMFTLSQVGGSLGKEGTRKKSSRGPRVFADDDDVYVQLSGSSDSDGDWTADNEDGDWTADKNKRKKSKNQSTTQGKRTSGTPNRRAQQTLANDNPNTEDRFAPSNKTKVQEQPLPRNEEEMMHSGTAASATQECLISPMPYGITEHMQDGVVMPNSVVFSHRTMGEPCRIEAMTTARVPPVAGLNKLGRLDLNVELNNEAEEPSSKANPPIRRGDDTIEGIGFFEGLDEFLSNLPILNAVVGNDRVFRAP